MWLTTLLLLLLSSSCWALPPSEENKETNMKALDILQLIEQALTRATSDTVGGTESQAEEQSPLPSFQLPWIDSLLDRYVASGTPENISEGVASIIIDRSAVDEKFKAVVIRKLASSNSFINFALQAYSLVKDGLLQWFVTSASFRSDVLQDITCSEVSKLLEDFTSSLPVNTSGDSFSEEHSFAWKILQKWGEGSCFKNALLGRFMKSEHLHGRIELRFSHSKEFSKAVVLGFLKSEYFVESLVTEYTASDHLVSQLLHQLETMETFGSFLVEKLIADESFQQVVFEYLSTIELNATKIDLNIMILKRAVESTEFRKTLFVQILTDSDFKEAISGAFLASPKFQFALVKTFASRDNFKREVIASQAMMDDALQLFETYEFFRNAVLELVAGQNKVKMSRV